MKVVISAGGTGGHIYPALAIINKIKEVEPNSEFLYIGTHNRMEKDIIPSKNIPYVSIEVYGLSRKKILSNFKVIYKLLAATIKTRKIIKKFNPDVVIGVGGYVTIPVILSGFLLGKKTFIHEQNSVPGLANRFLSKLVTKVGVSFESSTKYLPSKKTVFTGNPCSEEAMKKDAMDKSALKLSDLKKLVYIVMGSLGSSFMNNLIIKTLPMFADKKYEVVFVTGKDLYNDVIKNKFPDNVKVFPYIEDQTRIMKKIDLMVTRCGASTLSEIIALEIPSILIPSPYVSNNHQYKNALDLINQNAAVMIEEVDLKSSLLVETIDNLIFDEVKLLNMKANLYDMRIDGSATKIYELLKEMSK